jgi:hypothetical protein
MRAMHFIVLITAALLVVTGCISRDSVSSPKSEQPEQPIKGMGLVGKWVLMMRWETSVIGGAKLTLTVTEENCQKHRCLLSGYLEFPPEFSYLKRRTFSGFSDSENSLIRIVYEDPTDRGEPRITIMEFDLYPGPPAPSRAMVGFFVTFDIHSPGPSGEDNYILRASGRGMLTVAGRVSAYPLD